MPRPANKKDLLECAKTSFAALLDFIDGLPDETKNKVYENDELNDRDKTISDVLCHLHEWHLMRINWYKTGMSGKIPELSYSLQTLPLINHQIWEKHKGTSLKKAVSLFKKSHKDVTELMEKHTDEELFTKRKYQFTGSTSLGAYFFYNTSSHYDWGLKTTKPLEKLAK